MLAYVYQPFFYLPFKSGKSGVFSGARILFMDNITINNIIIGVYDSNDRLICCSHYKDAQGNYVLNTDVVFSYSRYRAFDVIELPYLDTGYESFDSLGKKFLKLSNGTYYVKIIRVGSSYAPNREDNRFEFVVNIDEARTGMVIQYNINSMLTTESIRVYANVTPFIEETTTIVREFNATIPADTDDGVKGRTYMTPANWFMGTPHGFRVRAYVDVMYYKYLGNTRVRRIGAKRLVMWNSQVSGSPIKDIMYSQSLDSSTLKVFCGTSGEAMSDSIDLFNLPYGYDNNPSRVVVSGGYKGIVPNSSLINYSIDTEPINDIMVVSLNGNNATIGINKYDVGSYTERYISNTPKGISVVNTSTVNDTDDWVSSVYEEILAESYLRDINIDFSSVSYDGDVIRDITNTITADYDKATNYSAVFELDSKAPTLAEHYTWKLSVEYEHLTSSRSCEYLQPIEWGDYNQIRFTLSNWRSTELRKNFISNYAIEDVPVYTG